MGSTGRRIAIGALTTALGLALIISLRWVNEPAFSDPSAARPNGSPDPATVVISPTLPCSAPERSIAQPAEGPAGMAWVPPGTASLGDTVYPEETPRTAPVAGFWMDRTEVTNAQFAAFVHATGYRTVAERPLDPRLHAGLPPDLQAPGALVFSPPKHERQRLDPSRWWRYQPGASWRHPGGPGTDLAGRDDWPVIAVTLEDAKAYAHWAGRELPTETEWEWAARGATATATGTATGAGANTWQGEFPWHDSGEDGHAGLAPVACHPPNRLELYDLIGNVWELVQGDYAPGSTRVAVIKGGSFLCSPDYCQRARPGARQAQEIDLATTHIGFRTILRPQETPRHDLIRNRQGRPAPQIP
jgi:sulfatase modifying factor 1